MSAEKDFRRVLNEQDQRNIDEVDPGTIAFGAGIIGIQVLLNKFTTWARGKAFRTAGAPEVKYLGADGIQMNITTDKGVKAKLWVGSDGSMKTSNVDVLVGAGMNIAAIKSGVRQVTKKAKKDKGETFGSKSLSGMKPIDINKLKNLANKLGHNTQDINTKRDYRP